MNYETTVQPDSGHVEMSDSRDDLDGVERRGIPRKWLIAIVALAIVIALAAAFVLLGGNDGAPVDDKPQVPVVSVTSPGRATVEGTISTTGTLAARREMPVGIAGEGGRVVSVTVDAGDWVRQGQVLAVIDRAVQNQQAAAAAAQVQVARADARLAQSNLDRALQLVERGFISKADVDRLTATRDAAVARVGVAEAQLGELRARNSRLSVVAPAAGLVLERNVEPGAIVGAGSGALFRIARGGEMELLADLGEVDLARISVGAPATVKPVGIEGSFTGQVWQIAPVIDSQDRQGTARVALAYAPGLRPGGFASAEIASGTTAAPVLPESAILSDDTGSYVYIIDPANKVVRRPVRTGEVTARGILITEGLTGRERIVLRAGGFLNPGDTVKPVQAAD